MWDHIPVKAPHPARWRIPDDTPSAVVRVDEYLSAWRDSCPWVHLGTFIFVLLKINLGKYERIFG